MKRFLTVLLTLCLLLGLSGCVTEPEIHGTVEPRPSVSSEPSQPSDPEPSQPSDPEPSEPTKPTEPSEPTEPSFSLGGYVGGIYTNRYLGLRCELGSGWLFYTADQLQELPDAVKDALQGSALDEYMEQATQVMDMMAENLDELTVINLLYSKLSLTEQLAFAAMTEEQVIDNLLAQEELMKESYAQMGIQVQQMKKVTVTFLGETHYALWTGSTINDVAYYTLQLYDYSAGVYGATLTLASYVEDKTQTLLPLFEKLN